MTDNYRARLERELASLRVRRVNARRTLEMIANGHRIGDALDMINLRRNMEIELRGSQPRWEELHHLLGLQHRLAPPVKLLRRR